MEIDSDALADSCHLHGCSGDQVEHLLIPNSPIPYCITTCICLLDGRHCNCMCSIVCCRPMSKKTVAGTMSKFRYPTPFLSLSLSLALSHLTNERTKQSRRSRSFVFSITNLVNTIVSSCTNNQGKGYRHIATLPRQQEPDRECREGSASDLLESE